METKQNRDAATHNSARRKKEAVPPSAADAGKSAANPSDKNTKAAPAPTQK